MHMSYQAMALVIASVAYSVLIVASRDIEISQGSPELPLTPADWPERFASAEALRNVTTPQKAEAIVSAARLVLRHYPYANNWSTPRPAPPKWSNYFSNLPEGYCDEGARVFADILGEWYGAKNFNMVTHVRRAGQPGFSLERSFTAHTASVITLENGAVLIDPMYGIMLVTERDDFSNSVFRDRAFKAYSLYTADDPGELRSRFAEYGNFYQRMSRRSAYAAYTGERLRVRQSKLAVPAFGSVTVGEADGSADDVTSILGAWGNHVGFWYEPTTHVWEVDAESPGLFEVRMDLIEGDDEVLGAPLEVDIEVDGGILLTTKTTSQELVVRYASLGNAMVKTTSKGTSGRAIDRIVARQLPF